MELISLPVNLDNQRPMAAYMKNRFVFLGLKAPQRQAICQDVLKASKQMPTEELMELIGAYYNLREREYQYLAIDLAIANVKRFSKSQTVALAEYVSQKAWWDSVDAWRKFFGLRIKYFPDELQEMYHHFHSSDDFWMRRVAINLQLMQKDETDLVLLTKAILKDQETDEFFIQKAIGWSLRQYSKTDPQWVRQFLEDYQLSPLAVREATKHLK
ncbi:DNA alkylation repair protein [uncultured Vagococcus sp.]|uniref:DNA alkylation repair protein n=1 Tax=uncultured Vagococcus sp. TaxID=189676 RepID=UPI0028D08742|nr:DNA alkylation repair protein [uncultured Vagococcus sp.]